MSATTAEPLDVKLSVGRVRRGATSTDVLVRISPPTTGARAPTDVCMVVDVSGSMGDNCSSGDKNAEASGLSILDVVKHAVKTVIATLQPGDRFSLIKFASTVQKVLPLTIMDDKGREQAIDATNILKTEGATELWMGLELGLTVLQEAKEPNRMSALFLLTDGQPSSTPPEGFLAALEGKKGDNHDLGCSVNTFGFGYNLVQDLLPGLAQTGQGSYAFIPDGSCVGTVFVNAISNVLATAARKLTLKITSEAKNIRCPGWSGAQVVSSSWGLQVALGALQVGQTRDVIVTVDLTPEELASEDPTKIELGAEVSFVPISANNAELQTVGGAQICLVGDAPPDSLPETEVTAHALRLRFVDQVLGICATHRIGQDGGPQLLPLIDDISKFVGDNPDPRMADLCNDLKGQTTESLKPAYWQKWGRHFLPSLVGAHRLQQCNNFKDPGVQHYGGDLFAELRDASEEQFLKLPPPTPSISVRSYTPSSYGSSQSAPAAQAAPVNMAAYYNAGGG